MIPRPARWLLPSVVTGLGLMFIGWGCSQDSNESTSGAVATNNAIVIEPNQSVGPIRAGMSVQQVISTLGEPQRRTPNALEYPRLGLAVMPGPDGGAQVVMCGDVTGLNGPFAKAFKGRTKEGIGMFSARADVLRAYGEPTQDQKMGGGLESMKYEPLGITFTLEAGKVHHMIVRLRGNQETESTIMIETAPPQGNSH